MKMTKLTTTAALLVAIATFTVTSSKALTSIQVQEIKTTVLGVPVPEMPAKAAELVQKAERKDRQAVAVTAVRAVIMKHRTAAPLVIAAVSKAAPEIASAVAVAAVQVASDQAPAIARAAASSAPAQATEISNAVGSAVPAQAHAVAATVNRFAAAGGTAQGTAAGATANPVIARGSAATEVATGGQVSFSNKPINQDTGFPFGQPEKANEGVVIQYNGPQQP
jgi:hypothetical protein